MKKRKNTTRRVTVKKGKIQPRPPKRPSPGGRFQPKPPKRPSPGGRFQPKPRPKLDLDKMILPPRPRKKPSPRLPRGMKDLTPEQKRRIMQLVKKGRRK